MKYLYLTALLFAIGTEALAQAVDQEKALEFKTGYNFITPTRRHGNDWFSQTQYNHFISYQDRKDQPRVGLLLNPQITFKGLYGSSEDKFYHLLQPGKASLIPALYVTAPAKNRMELYAYADAGLKVFPLLGDENVFRFFTQWQAGIGGGLRLNPYLAMDAKFIRAGHDFADRDKDYFMSAFSPQVDDEGGSSPEISPYFNAIQANAKIYLFPLKNNSFRSSYVFVNWNGFYKSYGNESFWTVGISYSPFHKVRKTPPYASPLTPNREEQTPESQLTLTAVKHLEGYRGTFELSGLTASGKTFYAVADNRSYLYGIRVGEKNWAIVDSTAVKLDDPDLEGVSSCRDGLYFVAEKNNDAYKVDKNKSSVESVTDNIPEFTQEKKDWQLNAGLEGIAVNCKKNVVYLAKERANPTIYKLDNGKIEAFSKSLPKETDISDLFYFNNSLYILERKNHQITKLNSSGEPVQFYSFHHVTTGDGLPMYGQSKSYGFAEALLITKDKIYIGMDPNTKENSTAHNTLNDWFIAKHSSKGASATGHPAVILVFDKPKNF